MPKLIALSIWQTLSSVAAAFFGVQSSRVRKRDLTHGNPTAFILAGFIMTFIVIGLFYAGVQFVLAYYGVRT